jgi:hypothetical protein
MERCETIDPKDYPFRHHIEANKHLDTDERRHEIKCIVEQVDRDYRGREHLFCDKEQVRNGKFRRPKILVEAEQAGFTSVLEHYESKLKQQKEDDDKRQRDKDAIIETLATRSKVFENYAREVEEKLAKSQADFEEYKRLTEERFNKLVKLISK